MLATTHPSVATTQTGVSGLPVTKLTKIDVGQQRVRGEAQELEDAERLEVAARHPRRVRQRRSTEQGHLSCRSVCATQRTPRSSQGDRRSRPLHRRCRLPHALGGRAVHRSRRRALYRAPRSRELQAQAGRPSAASRQHRQIGTRCVTRDFRLRSLLPSLICSLRFYRPPTRSLRGYQRRSPFAQPPSKGVSCGGMNPPSPTFRFLRAAGRGTDAREAGDGG